MTGSDIATIICAAIAALSAITVAVVEKRAARERKTTEKRAERRAKESRLSMDMMYASCSLAMDTATALRDGHTNGTLEGNLKQAAEAKSAYEDFIRNEAAYAVAKV
jgi:hypothetical protein